MILKERYASAVNSSNLSVKSETTYSDTDCLTGMGIAARVVPLGVALQRLFVEGRANQCVQIMANMAIIQSAKIRSRITPAQAFEISKKVLAWYRFGTCSECGGTGKEVIIEPKPHLSDEDCHNCRGTGRRPFEEGFKSRELEIAVWLSAEVSREQAAAGREAMRVIAPSLDL